MFDDFIIKKCATIIIEGESKKILCPGGGERQDNMSLDLAWVCNGCVFASCPVQCIGAVSKLHPMYFQN